MPSKIMLLTYEIFGPTKNYGKKLVILNQTYFGGIDHFVRRLSDNLYAGDGGQQLSDILIFICIDY